MHESGLVIWLVKKINAIAKEHGATSVSKIYLQISQENTVSFDHIIEHFRHASDGSACQGACIEFEASDDDKFPDPTAILLKGVELEYRQ